LEIGIEEILLWALGMLIPTSVGIFITIQQKKSDRITELKLLGGFEEVETEIKLFIEKKLREFSDIEKEEGIGTKSDITKIQKCLNAFDSDKWEWRTAKSLMALSGMNKNELEQFVNSRQDIIKSSINDIHGNPLYKQKKKKT
jgi:hypothetical protein